MGKPFATRARLPDPSAGPLRIFAPCGMLGYGIPEASFQHGLARDPHVLAADAGSTDPGPYYLGAGVSFTDVAMVRRDLALILTAAHERGLPVVIGSAGGGGARSHLRWLLEIVDAVIAEHGLRFAAAVVPSDVPPTRLRQALRAGDVSPLDGAPPLDEVEIERAAHIVAQMGPEPIVAALREAQLVICGRACDPAVMAAPGLLAGYPAAPAMHLGKLLECGAAAATPRHGTDGLLGTLDADGFSVEPVNPAQVCTIESVAAHQLYERADPLRSHWPGGVLDLAGTRFTQLDARTVRVTGSRYHPAGDYRVKLEGATRRGYRTITIAGVRDPRLLAQFEEYETNVRRQVEAVVAPLRPGADYTLHVHVYGRDGVMGVMEPTPRIGGHEVGLVIEAVAPTEAVSRQVLAASRSAALHATYPGRQAIAGNLAFPFSPSDIGVGDVYEFNIYHLMRLDDPLELFPIRRALADARHRLAPLLDREPAIA